LQIEQHFYLYSAKSSFCFDTLIIRFFTTFNLKPKPQINKNHSFSVHQQPNAINLKMQPNLMSNTIVLTETLVGKDEHTNGDNNNNGSVNYDKTPAKDQNTGKRKLDIVWINVIAFVYLHVSAVYGIFLVCTAAKFATFLFGEFIL
jgi:hypothetical protein